MALASAWNLLAGYAGLVSVGQHAYVGLGGYLLFRANLKSHSNVDVQASIAYGKRMKVYPLAQAANPPATVFTDVKDRHANGKTA